MTRAFQIHPDDNVATLLAAASAGAKVQLTGAGSDEVTLSEPIEGGHKLALVPMEEGAAVVKYGVRIGHATRPINPGDWVHLHNVASDYDERSASLNVQTGAPTDTDSAYA